MGICSLSELAYSKLLSNEALSPPLYEAFAILPRAVFVPSPHRTFEILLSIAIMPTPPPPLVE